MIIRPQHFDNIPIDQIDNDRICFYDIETDHQFATYAKLKTCAVQYGFDSKPIMLNSKRRWRQFKEFVANPDNFKVDFNGCNFDQVVLKRHNIPIHPRNRHDVFLLFKTISPSLPAYGQKFLSFYYLGDPHFAEHKILSWCHIHGKAMHEAPPALLRRYNQHDVKQLVNLFRIGWDIVRKPAHWDAYMLDIMVAEPVHEMELEGGIDLDKSACWKNLQRLQKVVQTETKKALDLTGGQVTNANSSQQLAKYLTEHDKIELELTDNGEFSVKKSVLIALRKTNPLADCAFNIRSANGTAKYFENYLHALEDTTYNDSDLYQYSPNWIPIQLSISGANTRRFTSQSFFRLNFQNPNSAAKAVQLVRQGSLGFWFDATQIENVIHIYESKDEARRASYEADKNWNEYVWLCNQMYGKNKPKAYWDDDVKRLSPRIPNWTIYKEAKTGKLAINFGMGITKFGILFGLDRDVAEETFNTIHRASPAIKQLQGRVAYDLSKRGYVSDAFGHRYAGSASNSYKVVAYLIQGCGTGSLPKAQIRANWESLRRADRRMPVRLRHQGTKCGVMCGTTHDENGGRIDLRLGDERILQLLQKLNGNMTEKFSPLFDNIPLRSKLYLSKTNAKDRIECDINDHEKILTIINGTPCPVCIGRSYITTDSGRHQTCNHCKSIGYVTT
jgi:hypothetical protein